MASRARVRPAAVGGAASGSKGGTTFADRFLVPGYPGRSVAGFTAPSGHNGGVPHMSWQGDLIQTVGWRQAPRPAAGQPLMVKSCRIAVHRAR